MGTVSSQMTALDDNPGDDQDDNPDDNLDDKLR
jgi:hypothetical protein